jgi:hypothetical protein
VKNLSLRDEELVPGVKDLSLRDEELVPGVKDLSPGVRIFVPQG